VADVRLILGGPGCGKTTRLLNIVEEQLARGVPSDRIAYLAFTRKAAREAAQRAMLRFSLSQDDLPYFRTLHSLAFETLGLTPNEVMQPAHYFEFATALGVEFSEMRDITPDWMPVGNKRGDQIRTVEMLSRVRQVPLKKAWEECAFTDIPFNEVEQYSEAVLDFKSSSGLVDYIDMVDAFNVALPVDVVIIDEAQDLSAQQWRMAVTLARQAKLVFIGGDDDQAIFQWAGADVEQFLNIEGEREVLPVSHRLPRTIFNLANTISARIGKRYTKDWKPRDEEGAVNRIADATEAAFDKGSWMVLSRQRHGLFRYSSLLRQLGYPYVLNGRSSLDIPEVRALLTWEALRKGSTATLTDVRQMLRMVTGAGAVKHERDYLLADLPLRAEQLALPWFDVLDNMAIETREYLRACLRNGEKLRDPPRIHLSTIHAVKGGEADNVLVSPMVKGSAFNNRDTDAEHRVFYVAATRAKQALWIPEPTSQRFYKL